MKKLTGNDPMPFGKHMGVLMKNVPAEYLDWIYRACWIDIWPEVKSYIKNNLKATRQKLEED